ncbi:MAG: glycosyltransferase family 87 protein [Chthoniobacteraceae bacterium]
MSTVKGYIYPPLMAWLLQPLTLLPIAIAHRCWQAFTFLLTTSSMWVGYRTIARYFAWPHDWRTTLTVMLAALILSAGEAKTEWSSAQCDSLVLDAFCFSLALLHSQPVLAGLIIAFGINIKYQTLLLLPYLLWRRHFKVAGAAISGTVLWGLLPMLGLGWAATKEAWAGALGGMGKFIGLRVPGSAEIHDLTWDHSISVTSAFGRGLSYFQLSPSLAFTLGAVIVAAGIILLNEAYRAARLPLIGQLSPPPHQSARLLIIEWCIILVTLLTFGPQTTRRHLFLLLFFHLAIASLLLLPGLSRPGKKRLLIALIVSQLALRLPPSASWCQIASDAWKWIGGPSWGILFLLVVLIQTTLAHLPASDAQAKRS